MNFNPSRVLAIALLVIISAISAYFWVQGKETYRADSALFPFVSQKLQEEKLKIDKAQQDSLLYKRWIDNLQSISGKINETSATKVLPVLAFSVTPSSEFEVSNYKRQAVKTALAYFGLDSSYSDFNENNSFKANLGSKLLYDNTLVYYYGPLIPASGLDTFTRQNHKSLLAAIKSLDPAIQQKIGDYQQRIVATTNSLLVSRSTMEAMEKELSTTISATSSAGLLKWALPIFGAILVILMLVPSFYITQNEIVGVIFQKGLLLELVTVFLLIGVILILGMAKILTSEVLGTLLGGISVYVLQRGVKVAEANNIDAGKQQLEKDKTKEQIEKEKAVKQQIDKVVQEQAEKNKTAKEQAEKEKLAKEQEQKNKANKDLGASEQSGEEPKK